MNRHTLRACCDCPPRRFSRVAALPEVIMTGTAALDLIRRKAQKDSKQTHPMDCWCFFAVRDAHGIAQQISEAHQFVTCLFHSIRGGCKPERAPAAAVPEVQLQLPAKKCIALDGMVSAALSHICSCSLHLLFNHVSSTSSRLLATMN